jgi:hypothetical protein
MFSSFVKKLEIKLNQTKGNYSVHEDSGAFLENIFSSLIKSIYETHWGHHGSEATTIKFITFTDLVF